jgi:hypothetical protein
MWVTFVQPSQWEPELFPRYECPIMTHTEQRALLPPPPSRQSRAARPGVDTSLELTFDIPNAVDARLDIQDTMRKWWVNSPNPLLLMFVDEGRFFDLQVPLNEGSHLVCLAIPKAMVSEVDGTSLPPCLVLLNERLSTESAEQLQVAIQLLKTDHGLPYPEGLGFLVFGAVFLSLCFHARDGVAHPLPEKAAEAVSRWQAGERDEELLFPLRRVPWDHQFTSIVDSPSYLPLLTLDTVVWFWKWLSPGFTSFILDMFRLCQGRHEPCFPSFIFIPPQCISVADLNAYDAYEGGPAQARIFADVRTMQLVEGLADLLQPTRFQGPEKLAMDLFQSILTGFVELGSESPRGRPEPKRTDATRRTPSPYRFYQDNNAYEIIFENRTITAPSNSKGMRILDILLHTPGKEWDPVVLAKLAPKLQRRDWQGSQLSTFVIEDAEDEAHSESERREAFRQIEQILKRLIRQITKSDSEFGNYLKSYVTDKSGWKNIKIVYLPNEVNDWE